VRVSFLNLPVREQQHDVPLKLLQVAPQNNDPSAARLNLRPQTPNVCDDSRLARLIYNPDKYLILQPAIRQKELVLDLIWENRLNKLATPYSLRNGVETDERSVCPT
jgi:hypothetical protein